MRGDETGRVRGEGRKGTGRGWGLRQRGMG